MTTLITEARNSMVALTGLALLVLAATSAPAADAAKPKITVSKAKAVKVIPIGVNRFAYTDRVYVSCRGKATPLMIGWSSPDGSIGSAFPTTVGVETEYVMTMVAPARQGSFKGSVTCLNRQLKTTLKQGRDAGEGVSRTSCSKRQLALGMPVRNAPYYDGNVYSRPLGTTGWETNEGAYAKAVVVCVAKRSMRAVKYVYRSVPFPIGTATTTVSANCEGGRVPISWGFESDELPSNRALGSSLWVGAPLISSAKRKGARGWSLTFFTPDGKPAVDQGRVALHLTCAKPR